MKNLLLFFGCLLLLTLLSCSDDESQEENINVQLLLGNWKDIEACENSVDGISFSVNNTYTSYFSDDTGNCSFSPVCGRVTSGTYSINTNRIMFSNSTSEDIQFSEDQSCVSVSDSGCCNNVEITKRITILTETELTITTYIDDDSNTQYVTIEQYIRS